jgi:DNA repair photolyase
VPVGVLVAPVIPALNDHEIPAVLAAAKAAGAGWAGMEILRLPLTVAPIFEEWLERNVPGKKDKVLNRIRAMRGGKLNDPRFGHRMRGEGIFADQILQMFHVALRKAGLAGSGVPSASGQPVCGRGTAGFPGFPGQSTGGLGAVQSDFELSLLERFQ